MSKLETASASFKAKYERFLTGCDAVEEADGWDKEANGEMDGYYTNDLICIILRMVTADNWVGEKETEYVNKFFGFDYTRDSLEETYENCKELIEGDDFDAQFVSGVRLMEGINARLAAAYKELLELVCEIIMLSDGFSTDEEKAEIVHLRTLLG